MPQLDISTYLSQILWLIIVFALLFSFVKYFFCPAIEEVLVSRKDTMKKHLEEAEKLMKQTKALQLQADSLISASRDKAREIKGNSAKDAHEMLNSKLQEENDKVRLYIHKEQEKLEAVRKQIEYNLSNVVYDIKINIRDLIFRKS